ncbi:Flp pilus assembly complex ATPase component TadA [Candidatus Microgenomates bacterium]|nr:Flp pilus assembly complex ATPase component TadA [Candidatus Microgenomates bacterium]
MNQASAQHLTDILINDKVITDELASQVKFEAINKGISEEEILIQKYKISAKKILQAKGKILETPYVDLSQKGISPEILSLIPEPVARRYSLIPFELDSKKDVLKVAMVDPLDFQVIEFLEKKAGKKIETFLSSEEEIKKTIDEQYARSLGKDISEVLEDTAHSGIKTIEAEKISEIIKEPPIAKIVSYLLEYAVKSRASDVHIEPQEQKTRVRYRIDGILREKLALPRNVHSAVASRIKILSDMKIDERRIPQDGRFNFKLGSDEVDLRISTLPTIFGEKIVMRLLKKTGGIPTLLELGLRGLALKNLDEAITRPYGIVLVTGPTGSGKTTTLYSVLSKLNSAKVNIITLEDPVEYQMMGVNQVQINAKAGLTFATGLRSFLRQDPDIILVGEIRDVETTQLAINAALTGHSVFSTLHTNDSAGALPRLLDMGAEPFLVASCLHCVVGQRICRRICPSCKESFQPTEETILDIKEVLGSLFPKDKKEIKLYKGKGCEECNKTGYSGRTGIFEVLPISEKIEKLILEKSSSSSIQKTAVAEGMIVMKQDGYLKVIEGLTTIEEVLRVAED